MEKNYETTARYLLSQTSYRPEVGIICGSGLSQLSKSLANPETIPYHSIPGFPTPTVHGHSGELVFGTIGSVTCVCMKGRFHFYEGHTMDTVALPIRAMRLMGVKLLIVTNAAGGLNPEFNVGDIMVIQDHFGMPCLAGNHPLRGINDDELGPRFPSISDAYDAKLQAILMETASSLDLSRFVRPNGTYCYVSGPSYESRIECRFLRSIGGDSVGMSTVPEVIAAKHAGMKILGLSLITNKVVASSNPDEVPASHAEVLEAVVTSGQNVEDIVKSFVGGEAIRSYLADLPAPAYPISPAPVVAAAVAAVTAAVTAAVAPAAAAVTAAAATTCSAAAVAAVTVASATTTTPSSAAPAHGCCGKCPCPCNKAHTVFFIATTLFLIVAYTISAKK